MAMTLLRALVAAVTLGLCSCRAPAAAPRVVVLDDGVKMSADGRLLSLVPLPGYTASNPAWDGRAVRLSAARGETVAFQVVVLAGSRALERVDVQVSALVREGGGTIDAGRISRFREWYLNVTVPSASPAGSAGPGEYPDALVPAETPRWGLPVGVASGRAQGVWVDVAVPAAAAPGTYRGTVTVTAEGATLARLDATLTVHGFALPRERHLRWRAGYAEWERVPRQLGIPEGSPEWLALEEDLYRLAWEGHRIVPTTHYHLVPLEARGRGDALALDWTAFDRRFGRYLDGTAFADGVPINVFSLPLNLMRGWPQKLGRDPAALDTATITAAARLTARHFDERGWRAEDAFVYVADEPGPDLYPSIRAACAAIRAGDPRLRTSVAFYTEFARDSARIVSEMGGFVTLWDIAGDHADLPALRARQSAGDLVGIYQGGEPFQGGEALDDDGLALTTWPWIAWRYGLDSLFLYNMTEWTYFRVDRVKGVPWKDRKREIWENPLNQSWATNSQGVLVYPGAYVGIRGVVPSIRLKQVRRGMQDYEYLWLAREGGRGDVAERVSRRLVPRALHEAGPLGNLGPRGPWERDPRAWAAGRGELAAAIERRDRDATPAPR